MPTPNSEMQAVLDAHAKCGPLAIETLTPEAARQIPLLDRAAVAVYGQHITKKALAPMPLPVGRVEHKIIPAKDNDILVRIYTPKGDKPEGGWPALTYFHGGGWVIANLDTYDASCRALCDAADCIVLSVAYRQAPEHQWPAPLTDAVTAYDWVSKNAAQLNINPKKIAIGGESAGGNLAAVTCLVARDKGLVMPVHQLLIYPVTDIAHGINSVSAKECATAKPLNTPMLSWFYNHYLPDSADRTEPYISPLHASLNNLPSTTIILAEIDPLRSEGEAYAEKLDEAGNDVSVTLYNGVCHEFFGLAGLVDEADKAVAIAAQNLRKAFRNEQSMLERWASKLAA